MLNKLKRLLRRKPAEPHCSVVVVAAGSSERMGTDKMLMELSGLPVLVRNLMAFQKSPVVDDIVVVTKSDKLETVADMVHEHQLDKVSQVLVGGATRMESALVGVSNLKKGRRLVAIHDGARPLVTQELIKRVVDAANEHMSAVPAIPSTDTLKLRDPEGFVAGPLDRDQIVRVQTPQVFDADMIKGALTKAVEDGLPLTDDCSAMDMMGIKTKLVEGDPDNIKLTGPQDITLAEAILKGRGE